MRPGAKFSDRDRGSHRAPPPASLPSILILPLDESRKLLPGLVNVDGGYAERGERDR